MRRSGEALILWLSCKEQLSMKQTEFAELRVGRSIFHRTVSKLWSKVPQMIELQMQQLSLRRATRVLRLLAKEKSMNHKPHLDLCSLNMDGRVPLEETSEFLSFQECQ